MYGTIARFRVKPGREGELESLAQRLERTEQLAPGMLAQYVYSTDADPNDCYLVVMFESKDAYVANAQSPQQGARYQQFRDLLVADPEWHDGAIVSAFSGIERAAR